MRLIPNWKKCWKLASVRMSAIGIIVFSALDIINQYWFALPPDIREYVPNSKAISLVLFGLIILSRIIQFTEKKEDEAA